MNATEGSASSSPPVLLDIDVSVRPQSFDSAHLLEEHERGRKQDADDLNGTLLHSTPAHTLKEQKMLSILPLHLIDSCTGGIRRSERRVPALGVCESQKGGRE